MVWRYLRGLEESEDPDRRRFEYGLSGYPYWTLDIGAFLQLQINGRTVDADATQDPEPKWFWQGKYNEGVKDKGYCELYTSWLQMGTFLPMFRSHGTDTPREIWNFGEKGRCSMMLSRNLSS